MQWDKSCWTEPTRLGICIYIYTHHIDTWWLCDHMTIFMYVLLNKTQLGLRLQCGWRANPFWDLTELRNDNHSSGGFFFLIGPCSFIFHALSVYWRVSSDLKKIRDRPETKKANSDLFSIILRFPWMEVPKKVIHSNGKNPLFSHPFLGGTTMTMETPSIPQRSGG